MVSAESAGSEAKHTESVEGNGTTAFFFSLTDGTDSGLMAIKSNYIHLREPANLS